MVIEIDIEIFEDKRFLISKKMEIMTLIDAHFEGKHYLLIPLNLTDSTLDYLFKGDSTYRNKINIILNQLPSIYSMKNQINKFIKIIHDDDDENITTDKKIIFTKFEHLNFRIDSTTLLSENLSDCHFYESLVRKYINEHKSNYYGCTSFHRKSGGGSQIKTSFQEDINEKRLCLAVVDSDKDHQCSKLGETAKGIKSCYESASPLLQNLLILNCREKENLIPPSLYSQVLDDEKIDEMNKLKVLENQEDNMLLFYKFGKGLTKEVYLKSEGARIRVTYDKLINIIYPDGINLANYEPDDLLLPKFNKNITTLVTERILNKETIPFFEHLNVHYKTLVIELLEEIFSWGCAPHAQFYIQ